MLIIINFIMAYLVCYPQTVSTSFLLTTFLLLTIVHLAKQQIDISGACQARCDAMRQKGNRDAFKSDCGNQDECTRDCESCPKQVCDETTSSISYFQWHCPAAPEISKECKDLCNKFRDKGNPEKKTVHCNNLDTPEDQFKCKNECYRCPKFVCDSDSALHCPWDQFEGNCKLECDKARVRDFDNSLISHVGEIGFFCSEVHKGSANAEQLCLSTLRDHCPAYVQDEDNSDKYNCPSATDADLSGECRKFCDKYTNEQEKTIDCVDTFMNNFPYDDMAGAQARCADLCKSCETPQGINYVCDPAKTKYFYCPKDAPKRGVPFPPIKRSYKGPCKHRCDVSQGGGPQAFSIYCNKFYETPEERQRCVQVCTEECLEQDCRHYGKEDGIIFCKGDEQKVKQLRKEEERKNEQRRELNDQLSRHEHAIDELITVFVVIGILLVILIIAFFCSCWCNRKKMKGLDQQQLGQLGQFGPFGQVPAGQAPGQMATNPSVGLMGSGGQVPRQPSRPFSTGPSPIGGQQPMQVGSGVQGQGKIAPPTVGMWESK